MGRLLYDSDNAWEGVASRAARLWGLTTWGGGLGRPFGVKGMGGKVQVGRNAEGSGIQVVRFLDVWRCRCQ